MSSSTAFLSEFDLYRRAGIGVIAVRTAEPYRVIELLTRRQIEATNPFAVWSISRGWGKLNVLQPADDYDYDQATADPMKALKKITDFDKGTVAVMMWPHKPLDALVPMVQMLADYTRELGANGKRLVLVVPETWEVPPELATLISLMDLERPDSDELIEVAGLVLSSLEDAKRPGFSDDQMGHIVSLGGGMTSDEFETALSRSLIEQLAAMPDVDFDRLVASLTNKKVEIVKRTDMLELFMSTSMSDVGGLEDLKNWVRARAECFTPEAATYGVDRPKGCALIGPPGTGKSLASKAIGAELGLPIIRFDVSRLFHGIVGSSEARTRQALNMIAAMAPCVAFLDELDKAFDSRTGGGDSGVGKRVMGAILTFMQESDAPVFWVMAANRADGLPPEMLRKGRLDEVFAVLPPNEIERAAVIRIHLAKRNQAADIDDMEIAVDASAGFVAAEIEAAVKEAVVVSYSGDKAGVTGRMIADQLQYMKPLSVAFKDDFNAMTEWAKNNARLASTPMPEKIAKPSKSGGRVRTRRKLSTETLDG